MNTSILLVLIIFLSIYSLLNYLKHKQIENFDIKDISKIGDTVKDFGRTISSLPKQIDNKVQSISKDIEKKTVGEINKLTKEIDSKVKHVATDIKREVEDFFTKKLTSVFTQLGNIFKKGLIDPIFNVFIGIGSIFELIFKILLTVIDKIVSLPDCILPYFLGSIEDVVLSMYRSIVPKSIKNILDTIYSYTIKIFVDMFDNWAGYTKKRRKCYEFKIKDELSKMNSNFKKIDQSFKKDFGKLDFGSIKI